MPASVRRSTVAPSARAAISPGSRASSTDSWNVTTRPVNATPRSAASRCRRRVSSTASTSAVAMTSRSRGPTSPGCPRGAPPSTSRPSTPTSLSRRLPQARLQGSGASLRAPGGGRVLSLPFSHGAAAPRAGGAGAAASPAAVGIPPLAGPAPPTGHHPSPARRRPAVLGAHRDPRRGESGRPALGHQLPQGPAVRRGVLPARGARAPDLGVRVQPRLLLHRPPAPGQVADRGRRAAVRLQLLRLAVPLRGGRRRGGRRPRPAGPAAHGVHAARPARRPAARPRRLLLHPLPDRPAGRLPAGARPLGGRVSRRRPRRGPRTGPRDERGAGEAGPARLADRCRLPVRLRLRGEVERRLVPRVLRRPLAVLGPRGLAGGGRPQPYADDDPPRPAGRGVGA